MAENGTPLDAGQRGALHASEKVVDRIATHAAATTPTNSGNSHVPLRWEPRR